MVQKVYPDINRVKRSVDEVGTTDQSVLDTIQEAARRASSQMESEFIFLISDTIPFDDPVPDWFVQLANQLAEAYFWELQNGNKDLVESTITKIQQQREKRYGQVPTIIKGNTIL